MAGRWSPEERSYLGWPTAAAMNPAYRCVKSQCRPQRLDCRQTLPWDYFRVARHPRRTPEIPTQQLFFLEKRALQLFHSDDVSCHGHLVMTSELRGWGKLGITLRDEFL